MSKFFCGKKLIYIVPGILLGGFCIFVWHFQSASSAVESYFLACVFYEFSSDLYQSAKMPIERGKFNFDEISSERPLKMSFFEMMCGSSAIDGALNHQEISCFKSIIILSSSFINIEIWFVQYCNNTVGDHLLKIYTEYHLRCQ